MSTGPLEPPELDAALDGVLLRDRFRLRKIWRRLRDSGATDWTDLRARIAASTRARSDRAATVPPIRYDPALPISDHREEILNALRKHQALVICGETGSGKSTQLPKLCLEGGRGVAGAIGHTQPRRIAARSIARRISEELGPEHAQVVGWKVRFEDTTTAATLVKSMTDGVLLAELQRDRFLEAYDTIILDEAHERSLNVDFLLGVLKQLMKRRPDLKVIVTSATIDPQRFQQHFDGAPVIEVSGRTYPVEIRYRPLSDDAGNERELEVGLRDAIRELQDEGPGDILVFLPTERDIRDLSGYLADHGPGGMDVLPLYGRLAAKDQDRVFRPGPVPRVVLSTNVAETSLTVPGVRYVIDAGTARISRFSVRHGVQRLPIEAVSQASAEQRAGRCGRVQDGVCIRLYSEEDFAQRDRYTAPEIVRTNLASVILRMKANRLGEPETFPFVDRPPPTRIRSGYQTLFELRALDDKGRLTSIGRALAWLPVDPRFGRMAFEAARTGCLEPVLEVVAALSVQDPRERPAEARADADRVHARFQDPTSDFLGLIRLWRAYANEASVRSRRKLARWCHDHYLRPARMREWRDVYGQLRESFRKELSEQEDADFKADAVHRAVLSGLLDHVAERGSKHAYRGTRGAQVYLFPGSALFDKKPRWIVSAERVETTRLFARTIAPIRREWIEPLAQHLVNRTYRDAHWDERRGHVGAFERVALHGLVIVERRRVHYGPIHPVRAREIFLRHALVHGRYHSRAAFHRHNRRLVARAHDVAARLRRRDVVASADDLYAFFDERIPAGIYSGPTLEHWRDTAERDRPRVLYLSWEHAAPGAPDEQVLDGFPDQLILDGQALKLEYRYEPGHPADGISVRIPLNVVARVGAARLEWLVPGALPAKLAALFRTLPKSVRRALQPIQDAARRCVEELAFGQGDLLTSAAAWIERRFRIRAAPRDFRLDALEPHQRINVRVVDAKGKTIVHGRSLAKLRRQLAALDAPVESQQAVDDTIHTQWAFASLPEIVHVEHGGFTVPAYPCLQDEHTGVRRTTADTPERAAQVHRAGLRRLAALRLARPLARALERMEGWKQRERQFETLGSPAALRRQMTDRIVEHACALSPSVRDAATFDQAVRRGERALVRSADVVRALFDEILGLYDQTARKLMLVPPPGWDAPIQDMTQQIARLVEKDFLVSLPFERLQQMPRYLHGIDIRLQKLGYGALASDRKHQAVIQPHWDRYLDVEARNHFENLYDEELDRLRWMLEEYRISLFAQELGTAVPISPARVDAQWERVR